MADNTKELRVCETGPAVEYSNGFKMWCIDGKIHRLDGPAVIFSDRGESWWVDNNKIPCHSQEEFEKLMKLKAFW